MITIYLLSTVAVFALLCIRAFDDVRPVARRHPVAFTVAVTFCALTWPLGTRTSCAILKEAESAWLKASGYLRRAARI